jgi:hypothetical protein
MSSSLSNPHLRVAAQSILDTFPPQPQTPRRRFLEGEVDLFGIGGVCQLRTSLDTEYSGTSFATGTMFAVTAKEAIEVESFEFANLPTDSEKTLEVEIYTRQGGDYLSVTDQPNQWTLISKTTAVDSPDGIGLIAPRPDVLRSVQMKQGDSRSFYFTLKSQHLQVESPNNGKLETGNPYISDDYLQIDVGVSFRSYPFPFSVDADRAFQGKIHYRALQDCQKLVMSTELIFPFVVTKHADVQDIDRALTNGFVELLQEEATLIRWTQTHGLALYTVEPKNKGTRGTLVNVPQSDIQLGNLIVDTAFLDDCTEYGFEEGCIFYESILSFQHYQSLGPKELILEMTSNVVKEPGFGSTENDFDIVYIGDQILQQAYDITLTGIPENTILNPIQRNYIESVTYDFLEQFSDADPYLVEASQRVGRRLRYMRWDDDRHLQETGVMHIESTIYGIGDDLDAFRDAIEESFSTNGNQYRKELIGQQHNPGEINDNGDQGFIFAELFKVSISRDGSNETSSSADNVANSSGLESQDIQIIIFSTVLGIAFLWLMYRIAKDFLLVDGASKIKKEKLSDKKEREVEEAKEALDNMDKPGRKPPGKSHSFDGFEQFQASVPADSDDAPQKPEIRGRKAPEKRGVGRASTFDRFTFSDEPKKKDATSKVDKENRTPLKPPTRLDSAPSKSCGGGLVRSKPKSENSTKPGSDKNDQNNRPLPTRGVRKSATFNGVDGFYESKAPSASKKSATRNRGEPASRGVSRSITFDGNVSFFDSKLNKTNNGEKLRRASPTRGVRKSSTFSGVSGFMGSNQKAKKRPSWESGGPALSIDNPPPRPPRKGSNHERESDDKKLKKLLKKGDPHSPKKMNSEASSKESPRATFKSSEPGDSKSLKSGERKKTPKKPFEDGAPSTSRPPRMPRPPTLERSILPRRAPSAP